MRTLSGSLRVLVASARTTCGSLVRAPGTPTLPGFRPLAAAATGGAVLLALLTPLTRAVALERPESPQQIASDAPAGPVGSPATARAEAGSQVGSELHAGRGAPEIPDTFDRETVARLIRTLDQGHNASILKIGYFLRHSVAGLPKRDAVEMLYAAIAKEQAGSRRWYLLRAVVAFGSLRVGGQYREDAWVSYTDLFHSSFLRPEPGTPDVRARLVGAEDIVAHAVDDYVSTPPSVSGVQGAAGADKSSMALLAALAAYMEILRSGKDPVYYPSWRKTVAAVKEPQDLKKLISDDLEDFTFPRTYTVFKTAAEVYEPSEPEAAVNYLRQAQQYLDPKSLSQVGEYYVQLTTDLARLKQLPAAIEAQNECVRLTGTGKARLALLYLQNNDERGYSAIISELGRVDAPDKDVVDLAAGLTSSMNQNVADWARRAAQGQELLAKYLANSRNRTIEQDLRARLLLSRLYLSERKPETARTVLNGEPAVPPDAAPVVRLEDRALQGIRRRLSAGGAIIPQQPRPSQSEEKRPR